MNDKRIGMFGGTFDPIHRGHIKSAVEFYKRAELSKMYVIPTGIPPHKKRLVTPSTHRLSMAHLAFDKYKNDGLDIEVSDIETSAEGKSFTILTVNELILRNKCDRIYVYTGTDMFCCLEKWYMADELFRKCVFCVFPRENDVQSMEMICRFSERYKELYDARCMVMDIPALEMSSTDIRDAVTSAVANTDADGENPYNKVFNMLTKYYLTDEVAKYIIDNRLYFDRP